MENKVIKTSLVGHKDEVLCLDCPTSEKNKNLLISGSEDGTARVWDVRVNNCATSIRSTKLLYSPKRKPINCVKFAEGEEGENRVFLTTGKSILCYDLRMVKQPQIIYNSDDILFFQFPKHSDEINSIDISPNGKLICSVDDNGDVKIFNLESLPDISSSSSNENKSADQNLIFAEFPHNSSSPSSICSSAIFRNDGQIISAGFDCTAAIWNIMKQTDVPAKRFDATHHSVKQGGAQVINPPFIHSVSSVGRRIGLALGNSSVLLFDALSDIKQRPLYLTSHSSAVSQIVFPQYGGSENLLITGGNDSLIVMWSIPPLNDLSVAQPKRKTNPPPKQKPTPKGKKGKKQTKHVIENNNNNNNNIEEEKEDDKEKVLSTISHHSKINCLAVPHSENLQGNFLFVADQTSDITVYEFKDL